MLIGIIYFFPGFWKIWDAGFDWALGENIKYQLHAKWFELGGWTPQFRIDNHAFLYRIVGLGTIVFEISFIFLIFSKQLRNLAVVSGLMFHNLTNYFMRIPFWSLQFMYVVFLEWNKIFRNIGKFIFRTECFVIFDGNCKLCRKTIAILKIFDIFERITYVNVFDKEVLRSFGLADISELDFLKDMHVVIKGSQFKGYDAYRRLTARIPILWPILPFLYMWPITAIGRFIYKKVAHSRTCNISAMALSQVKLQEPRFSVIAMSIIGWGLILGNIIFGTLSIGHGWPLACFPTFAYLSKGSMETFEILILDENGNTLPFIKRALIDKFSSARFYRLLKRILNENDSQKQAEYLQALRDVIKQDGDYVANAKRIQFNRVTVLTSPEYKLNNIVGRKLVYEMDL